MMVNFKELVSEVQSVQKSFKDGDSSPVIRLSINSNDATCLVDTEYFLGNIEEFEVSRSSSQTFPVSLNKNIEGIIFKAYVSDDELDALVDFVPMDWIDNVKKQKQPEIMTVSKGGV